MASQLLPTCGTLLGFDDYVNMVLEDVTEFDYTGAQTKLPKILLNGNNVCMISQKVQPGVGTIYVTGNTDRQARKVVRENDKNVSMISTTTPSGSQGYKKAGLSF
ncbi:hypothetical protein CISG_08747 [Coccidioides immitis RMSCC 3703]|uniref:Sm domain-containing protein n=1 Tax=Coccidioides immitis RMSCC 3703 TaxID=454286 RepID=A0A0J8RA28_COCIT|nr:hypothetical protein CISG_08747 [Coccidioides immitis RMSCC 3703]